MYRLISRGSIVAKRIITSDKTLCSRHLYVSLNALGAAGRVTPNAPSERYAGADQLEVRRFDIKSDIISGDKVGQSAPLRFREYPCPTRAGQNPLSGPL